MPENSLNNPPAITLDQLIALNDEIVALVRSGVPLESNLVEVGKDLPGTLGRITSMLAQRASRGEPLPELIAQCSAQFPPVYRAVIEAGLRTGRLSTALEALANNVRRVADARRGIANAMLYPLFVVIIGWLGFAFFSAKLAPGLAVDFAAFRVPGGGFVRFLAWAGQWSIYWGLAAPVVLIFLVVLAWRQSGRATWIGARGLGKIFFWLPWLGSMLMWSRNAAFADMLALLVDSAVPLPEALKLAAEASSDRQLIEAAQHTCAMLTNGQSLVGQEAQLQAFPPLLRWLLPAASQQNILVPALKHAAEMYNGRAEHQADLLRVFTPVVLTICISGVLVLLYALTLFVPYTHILRALGG
jgi:type II secretory pathway component PulF